jgi:peptidoglycan/LPS O-acetylase OafA/YrhL
MRVKRLGYVDGLRALAALWVVTSHIALTAPAAVTPYIEAYSAHYAVALFIVLSGYSLMLPVARRDLRLDGGAWAFYRRRARRILPPYYAALALSLLLIWLALGQSSGRQWNVALPVTPAAVLQHLLLAQDFGALYSINYPLWSVAVECQIYLLFPTFVWLMRRYHPLICAALLLILALVLTLALGVTPLARPSAFVLTGVTPQFIGLFALGMFAAIVATSPAQRWLAWRVWRGWSALAALGVGVWLATVGYQAYLLQDALTGVVAVCVLLTCASPHARQPLRVALEWRPLVWIGGFSYSLYLIHAPLIQLLWQYAFHPLRLGDTATYWLLLLVGGPLIVLAAWGFYWIAERPFLNARRSSLARPRVVAGRLETA